MRDKRKHEASALRAYKDRAFRDFPCTNIEVNDIWSFTYAKQKNVEGAKAAPEGAGDTWTLTANRREGRDREVLGIEDFNDADIEAVRGTQPSKEAEAFNDEVAF